MVPDVSTASASREVVHDPTKLGPFAGPLLTLDFAFGVWRGTAAFGGGRVTDTVLCSTRAFKTLMKYALLRAPRVTAQAKLKAPIPMKQRTKGSGHFKAPLK